MVTQAFYHLPKIIPEISVRMLMLRQVWHMTDREIFEINETCSKVVQTFCNRNKRVLRVLTS